MVAEGALLQQPACDCGQTAYWLAQHAANLHLVLGVEPVRGSGGAALLRLQSAQLGNGALRRQPRRLALQAVGFAVAAVAQPAGGGMCRGGGAGR